MLPILHDNMPNNKNKTWKITAWSLLWLTLAKHNFLVRITGKLVGIKEEHGYSLLLLGRTATESGFLTRSRARAWEPEKKPNHWRTQLNMISI
jgi:hypothetical protein